MNYNPLASKYYALVIFKLIFAFAVVAIYIDSLVGTPF